MGTKRIKDLTETTALQSGDYIPVDNTSGTKKIDYASLIDDTLTTQGKFADAKAVGDAVTDLEGQIQSDQTVSESVPYSFRPVPVPTTREILDAVVGGTVAWNQLLNPRDDSKSENGISFSYSSTGLLTITVTDPTAATSYTLRWPNITSGHKLLMLANGLSNENQAHFQFYFSGFSQPIDQNNWVMNYTGSITTPGAIMYVSQSAANGIYKFHPMIIDLTLLFGSTIADYIYTLEQSTAGAGVAVFRKLFPADYYEYDAGTLKSVEGVSAHETVGFNQFDASTAVSGKYVNGSGAEVSDVNAFCSDYIPVVRNTDYYTNADATGFYLTVRMFDENKSYIGSGSLASPGVFNSGNAFYIRINSLTARTSKEQLIVNLSDPSRNGQYEPYKKYSYPLGSSLTLRGILKKDSSNNLYFDGDEYAPDGTVTRRYGVVDLGTLTWVASGSSGTERFLSSGIKTLVKKPSANNINANVVSKYPTNNVSHFSEMEKCVAVYTDGDVLIRDTSYVDAATFKTAMSGVYLVYELATPTTETADPYQQTQICDPDGTETFVTTGIVPVGHVTEYPHDLKGKVEQLYGIPKPPTANGTYALKVTVSGSAITYSWV